MYEWQEAVEENRFNAISSHRLLPCEEYTARKPLPIARVFSKFVVGYTRYITGSSREKVN